MKNKLFRSFDGIINNAQSILYTKGGFRAIYLTSALILLLTYIYIKLFGVVS